jgi:TPR repeat protein
MRSAIVLAVASAIVTACSAPATVERSPTGQSDPECDVFERSCPRDQACASVELAACLVSGWDGHPADPGAALSIYDRHCATGHLEACQAAAGLADRQGDRATALRHLDRACALSPLECEALGRAYERPPSGVAPDVVRARAAYQRGCRPPGISAACDALEELDKRAPPP